MMNVPTEKTAQVEALLDELLGGWPWRSWDVGLSVLLDQAVVQKEQAAG